MAINRLSTYALLTLLLVVSLFVSGMSRASVPLQTPVEPSIPDKIPDKYVVLSWNDLGMHCYNQDFQDLAVLPPYNVLWAQVIRVGDPPLLVTTGVTVTYSFDDNSYSVGKSNFWEYDVPLFGVDLPPNIGLTGNGLRGTMEAKPDHFVVDGIPLTEFRDSAPTTRYPYQLATVVVHDANSGAELARTVTVAPVSTEMHCDNCHFDGGIEDIATGRVETNILILHDGEQDGEGDGAGLMPAASDNLMPQRPVLCAKCHASNALGTQGEPGVPNLSNAMHEKHAGKVPDTTEGCYNCHPGPSTQCLRDVMSEEHGMQCVDCHGGMEQVAANSNPWLNEPRCDTCHDEGPYDQTQALYRNSSEHGGIYCAACHDSPHAIAPSREANDALKFIGLQGHSGPLDTCTVCHLTVPTGTGPHGVANANAAPTFVSTPPTFASVNAVYTYTIATHDTNLGDTLSIVAPVQPSWLNLTDQGDGTATLSGTPTNDDLGEHPVVLRVQDPALATATQSYTITVLATGGAVEGIVYFDTDADGQKDANEQGMAGVTVMLASRIGLRVSSARLRAEISTVTGADGRYHFSVVPVGTYTLTVELPSGYVTGEPEVTLVTVLAGTTAQVPLYALQLMDLPLDVYLPRVED